MIRANLTDKPVLFEEDQSIILEVGGERLYRSKALEGHLQDPIWEDELCDILEDLIEGVIGRGKLDQERPLVYQCGLYKADVTQLAEGKDILGSDWYSVKLRLWIVPSETLGGG